MDDLRFIGVLGALFALLIVWAACVAPRPTDSQVNQVYHVSPAPPIPMQAAPICKNDEVFMRISTYVQGCVKNPGLVACQAVTRWANSIAAEPRPAVQIALAREAQDTVCDR